MQIVLINEMIKLKVKLSDIVDMDDLQRKMASSEQ